MAFQARNFNDDVKNWGGVVVASEPYAIDLVEMNETARPNIVAGNVAYTGLSGLAVTSADVNKGALGIYVKNSVGLGQEDAEGASTEICMTGTIFANLKLGETKQPYGQKASVDGDRVFADDAGTFGRFTDVMGEPMADGSLVQQLRLNVN